jgi:hypothetical protein
VARWGPPVAHGLFLVIPRIFRAAAGLTRLGRERSVVGLVQRLFRIYGHA